MGTTMEADMTSILAEARDVDRDLSSGDNSDIIGMIVMDSQGLVVGSEGDVGDDVAGVLRNRVLSQASKQDDDGEYPVIVITSDDRKYLIKREDQMITTIIKKL